MSNPNTNAMAYNDYVTQIATLAVLNTTTSGGIVVGVDAAFNALIPQMLNYAELRIQRDLDLLPSQVVNTTYSLTAGTNTLSLSSNDFVTVQTVAYTSGTAVVPVLPASKEFIQNAYNDASATYQGAPTYFAVYGGDLGGGNTSNNLLFGPYPDQNYALTITGTQYLPSLYASSSTTGTGTTYISTNYPDLLVMASLIYMALYQRNFSAIASANDPMMAGSYEYQYNVLLKSAIELENRKKFRDSGWTSRSQSPVATP